MSLNYYSPKKMYGHAAREQRADAAQEAAASTGISTSNESNGPTILLAQILTSYPPPSWSATATATATGTATWLRARRTHRALPRKSRGAQEIGARPGLCLPPTRRSASGSTAAEGGQRRVSSSQPLGGGRGTSRRGGGDGEGTLE
jgi:hypothetical protein